MNRKERLARLTKGFLTLVAAVIATAEATAIDAADSNSESAATSDRLEEVIITGVTHYTPKLQATISVNTITEKDLQLLGANGTAQLLGNIPGFFPEGGTAGETHNNVQVRGLPQAGGFRYVPNLIDGLPAYEEPEAPFMNNDVFIKADLMTQRVEVVKGGPGGILYSNALAAAVNYITRTGTQQFSGGYKLEVGDGKRVRNDFFLSGPINSNLTYAVGGFFRTSNGVRDPGFTANSGGQLRANVVYLSDDESTRVFAQAHVINDSTMFYQNVPFAVPNTRPPGTDANPFTVGPDSVQSLGIDFGHGTPVSNQTSFYQLYNPDGSILPLDLKKGIQPQFNIFTLEFSKKFGSGWEFQENLRSTSGSNGFYAMFNDPAIETAQLTGQKFNYIQTLTGALGAAYVNAAGVKAYYTDTVHGTDLTTAEAAPGLLANDVPVYGKVNATSQIADSRLTKTLEFAGSRHAFTLGAYTAHYTYDVESVFARAYSDLSSRPRKVDLYAVDAAGQQVGPSITRDSVDSPALFGLGATSSELTQALYALDHMTFLDDRLNVDAGVRWQNLSVNRITTNSFDPGNSANDFTPNGVVVGSTSDSLAWKNVNVPDGAPQYASEKYNATGWSLGSSYRLAKEHDRLANATVYATVAKSFRLPGFEDYIFGGPATNPATGEIARGDQVSHIMQYEGGIRFEGARFTSSVALFFIDFKAKENLGPTLDDLSANGAGGVACTTAPAPANCPKIRDHFRQSLKNHGIEFEGSYSPAVVSGLHLQGSIVWQQPKLGQDHQIRGGIEEYSTTGGNVFNARRYIVSSTRDRTPRRQPEYLVNFRPSYTFSGVPLTVYAQMYYYSKRFAADDNANVTIYPAYTQFNGGVLYAVSDKLELQLHADNLNDAQSFTEGGSINAGGVFSDGRYSSLARPLLGRSIKASVYYRF